MQKAIIELQKPAMELIRKISRESISTAEAQMLLLHLELIEGIREEMKVTHSEQKNKVI